MNLRKLDIAKHVATAVGYLIATVIIGVMHAAGLGWGWLLLTSPLPFVPLLTFIWYERRNWKNGTYRGVYAVLNRELTKEEAGRLTKRGYKVERMYVSSVVRVPTPPDAALLVHRDLTACMHAPWEVEEITSRSINTTRRVATFVGRMDDLVDGLIELHERDLMRREQEGRP